MADTGERVATPPAYALQRSAGERQRLALQERVIGASTARFFEDAGIEAGMRVLDVGGGAGDVAMCIARRVGSSGLVLGVDIDGPSVEIATVRAAAGGCANVAFVTAGVVTADLGSDFDAAVGRLVLMHVQDPALVLGGVAGMVRPTGVLAFQEANLASRGFRIRSRRHSSEYNECGPSRCLADNRSTRTWDARGARRICGPGFPIPSFAPTSLTPSLGTGRRA
jgi:2-polyprenyl-3-methyl-5-hydroxy-6-metoxy-1,4-benzoquinol methylase